MPGIDLITGNPESLPFAEIQYKILRLIYIPRPGTRFGAIRELNADLSDYGGRKDGDYGNARKYVGEKTLHGQTRSRRIIGRYKRQIEPGCLKKDPVGHFKAQVLDLFHG
jgi:hypothetical protein